MRKAVPDQRLLFPSCLTWEQLPDSVRQQALDVLTALLLEATDLKQCGAQSRHRSANDDDVPLDPTGLSLNGLQP